MSGCILHESGPALGCPDCGVWHRYPRPANASPLAVDAPSPIAESLLPSGACPVPMRPEARRALELRLGRVVDDLAACRRAAKEIGAWTTARAIGSAQRLVSELASILREEGGG